MNKIQKNFIIEDVKKMFLNNEAIFIINNSKMKSVASQGLRKKLKELGGEIKVVKNTLLKRIAFENKNIKKLENFFENQISLVFIKKNFQKIALLIKNSGYEQKIIDFKVGMFDNKVFEKEKFEFISNIPSKEILYSRLCKVLLSPIARLAFVLSKILKNKKEIVKNIN